MRKENTTEVVTKIAKKLYNRASLLRKFTSFKLHFKKNQWRMNNELRIMERQVEELREAIKEDGSYSDEYFDLIDEIFNVIGMMDHGLTSDFRKSKQHTAKYASEFSVLFCPFFAADDPLKISPGEARVRHTKSWL